MDIISAYRELGSYRAAAQECGTTHRTVKRTVDKFEAGQAGVPPPHRAERAHNYDVVADLVAERVEKSHGRISAKRLLPVARAAGYEGSARNFRRLVADAKALWRSTNHYGRRPAVWEPGQYLVIDWAQAAPGLFLFCAVLAFSRWRFVRFATDQRASTTLALIAEALATVGGVPARVLADRMACLKGGVVANVVVPTPDYVRLASHYGFAPDFCHASDPQSKGIVENLCGYAQDDLAVPLLTEAAVTGIPVDLRTANAAAQAWCAEVNAATHSQICAVPDNRLTVERELLQPLPSLRLQTGAPSVLRKVDRLSCVRYGSARYSVPMRLIGTTVTVVVDHGAIVLLEPTTGMIVAEHELVTPGGVSILDAHYDGPRPAPSRGPRPKTTVEKQFCDLGADAEAFLVGAAAIGNTRLGSELEILLALGAAHGTDALVAALHRAVAVPPVPRRRRAFHPVRRHRNTPAPPRRGCVDPGPAGGPDQIAGRLQDRPGHRRRGDPVTKAAPITDAEPVAPPLVPPLAADLDAGLRRLKLAAVRRTAPEVLITAKTQRWTPEEVLRTLVETELAARDASNVVNRLKAAAFPVPKSLESFEVAASSIPPKTFDYLSSLEWIRTQQNLAIIGPAGTGKSHTLIGLGTAAIHAGLKVRYFTAADLVEALYRGLADNTVGKTIESLLRVDLIILDELGFAPLDDTGTQLLFRLVAGAYERRSLAIGSHWPFEQWGRFLPEQTTAVSILDRLLHHATVVITDGDSYRMKDAKHRKERPTPT